MDKIGILTFHRSENYGSVLQAWALCQQINALPDCQAELIDYSNRAQQDLYALFLPPKSVKNIAKNLRACLLLPYLLRRKAAFRDFIGALPKSAPMQTEADFAAAEKKIHKTKARLDRQFEAWQSAVKQEGKQIL